MQKKLFIIISVALILIAAIVCTVFLIRTADLEPESKSIELEGEWRVFRKGSSDPGQEYFVFSDTKVTDYRDGNPTPALESEYTLEGNNINISALSQNYTIEKKTNSVMLLYNESSEFMIVKTTDGAHTANVSYSQADVQGEFNVLLHGNSIFGEELIEFNGDKFLCLRNNETILDTTYTINDNVISVVTPNGTLNFVICYAGDDGIRFAELASDGSFLAWELEPAKN